MRTIFLVEPDELEKARKMEDILLSLPNISGVLFAGVTVQQAPGAVRKIIYKVVIGCTRDKESSTIEAVAKLFLLPEVLDESQLNISVYRGNSSPRRN